MVPPSALLPLLVDLLDIAVVQPEDRVVSRILSGGHVSSNISMDFIVNVDDVRVEAVKVMLAHYVGDP